MKGRLDPSGVLGGRLGAVTWRLSGPELGDALDQPGDDVVAAAYLLAVQFFAAPERLASLCEFRPQERHLVEQPLHDLLGGAGPDVRPNLPSTVCETSA